MIFFPKSIRLGEESVNPFSMQLTGVIGIQPDTWSITPAPFRSHDHADDVSPLAADGGETPVAANPTSGGTVSGRIIVTPSSRPSPRLASSISW